MSRPNEAKSHKVCRVWRAKLILLIISTALNLLFLKVICNGEKYFLNLIFYGRFM